MTFREALKSLDRARRRLPRGASRWTGAAWIWGLLVLTLLVAGVLADGFLTSDNLLNVLRQAMPLAVVSLGQTAVILSGGIDISVASLIAMCDTIAAGIMNGHADRIPLACAAALGAGLFVGLLNGVLVTATRVPAFIVTLGVGSIIQGVTFLYTHYASFGAPAPIFADLGFGDVAGVPLLVLFFLPVLALVLVFQNRTVFGRHLYALGDDERTARLAGVRTGAVKITAYGFSGLMAGLTGLVIITRAGTGEPLAGTGFDWDSIAAVVIGGTALTGGSGGVAGTMGGVLIISVLNNAMNFLNVSPYLQFLVKGLIIVVATVLSTRSLARLVRSWVRTRVPQSEAAGTGAQ